MRKHGGITINSLNIQTFTSIIKLSADMQVFILFYFIAFYFHALDGQPTPPGREGDGAPGVQGERTPRKIIRKIHNGVAFLAGVKIGSLLVNKGFEAGHGSLAATNSFRLFGKSVNSAISFSYGSANSKLPLLDDPGVNLTQTTKNAEDKEDVVHLTIVHNPSRETIDKLKRISNLSVAETNQTFNSGNDVIIVESQQPVQTDTRSEFIRFHNKMVNEFNNVTQRRNSKF